MKYSLGLPVERPDRFEELCGGEAMAELATAAEELGFDAVSVTDHPFPPDRWLAAGGHHAHEPLVALAYVAAATRAIRLHTNIYVVGYRNPFLAAKGVASLDALAGGRVILGVAPGYLRPEFEVLGADFEHRNDVLDESLRAMRAAWAEGSTTFEGTYARAEGHTMLPPPAQVGGPPIWIGGNSTRAIRRVVELADGWMPFPLTQGASKYTRTATIEGMDDLRARIGRLRELAAEAGRTDPIDICFVPFGLTLFDRTAPDFGQVAESVTELADAGVTWLSIALPAETRKEMRAQMERFADDVMGVQG
jgi:probable F420-dependent oxidoreductase